MRTRILGVLAAAAFLISFPVRVWLRVRRDGTSAADAMKAMAVDAYARMPEEMRAELDDQTRAEMDAAAHDDSRQPTA